MGRVLVGMTVGHGDESVRDVARLAAEIEQAGLDAVGFSDSQSVFRETYCNMTAAALATSRVRLMTTLTNVSTRHPVTTASAIASVDEASDGRALLGIGRGYSSVGNAGLPMARAKDLRAGVEQIKLAFAQSLGTAPLEGKTVLLSWAKRAVPVIVGANTLAPLATRVAAEVGDGVIFIGDVRLAVLREKMALVQSLREAAGVADRPFQTWVYTPGYVEIGSGDAAASIAGTLSSVGTSNLDPDNSEHEIPEEFREPLRRFIADYSMGAHASPMGAYAKLQQFGLAEFFYSRFSIGGTADDVAAHLGEMGEMGVTGVIFGGYVPDKRPLIDGLSAARARLA